MAIKQRQTPLDGILLKVVYPIMFSSGLGRRVLRWQVWHEQPNRAPKPSNIITFVPRIAIQKRVRPLSTPVMREKRVA